MSAMSATPGAGTDALAAILAERFPDVTATSAFGELTLFVPPERIVDVVRACRDEPDLDFELLSDLSGVHWPGGDEVMDPQISTTGWPAHRLTRESGSIEVVYHLASRRHGHRVRLVVALPDTDPVVASVTDVYPTADWHEREVWDLFGVRFEGHPNLVRILMPDEWVGHPLRKDYPLGGVDTEYAGGFVPPPDQRIWAQDVPGASPKDLP